MNVFFDVQGTLLCGGEPRPYVRSVFEELTNAGHRVYLWSSGGAPYARQAARVLKVGDLICGCFSKTGDLPASVDFVVDDFPDFVGYHGGYVVPPFDGDPDDRALLGVVPAVQSAERLRR